MYLSSAPTHDSPRRNLPWLWPVRLPIVLIIPFFRSTLILLPYIQIYIHNIRTCGGGAYTVSQATHLRTTHCYVDAEFTVRAICEWCSWEDIMLWRCVSDTCSQRTAPLGYLSLGLFGGFWPCLCTRLDRDKPVGVLDYLPVECIPVANSISSKLQPERGYLCSKCLLTPALHCIELDCTMNMMSMQPDCYYSNSWVCMFLYCM